MMRRARTMPIANSDRGAVLLTVLLLLTLVSAMLAGFSTVIMTDQRVRGVDRTRTRAFYAAHGALEQLTASLGNLFLSDFAPTSAEVRAVAARPPAIDGVRFEAADGGPGYTVTFDDDGGMPAVERGGDIVSGPFQGLRGPKTTYTLTVNARTLEGADGSSDVRLVRTLNTVAIPVFQFGIFSETDLSFFAGPNFNFGGRVHTNGNLFLAEGNGNMLTMADRVTVVGEVIRTNLSNGWATSTNYTGTVNVLTGTNTYRGLGRSEGSLVGTLGSTINDPTWHNLSLGTYNGNIRNGRTGAKTLNLPLVVDGGQTIDLIRRPVQNENTTNASVLGERYFAQASMKILLSDDKNDIMTLPCIDATAQPVDMSTLAVKDPTDPTTPLPAWYTAGIPLAVSGAGSAGVYTASDGYWIQPKKPITTGFLKIEIQTVYGVPCGTWKDVTQEILNLG